MGKLQANVKQNDPYLWQTTDKATSISWTSRTSVTLHKAIEQKESALSEQFHNDSSQKVVSSYNIKCQLDKKIIDFGLLIVCMLKVVAVFSQVNVVERKTEMTESFWRNSIAGSAMQKAQVQ